MSPSPLTCPRFEPLCGQKGLGKALTDERTGALADAILASQR